MCNRHSGVMLALYCVNTEIKMQAAHVKYNLDLFANCSNA